MSYSPATICCFKDGAMLKDREGRLQIQATAISNFAVLGSVMISSLRREDNGPYLCQAVNAYNMTIVSQDVVLQDSPGTIINVESVKPLDSRTAFIRWQVHYRASYPIKRFHLQVKNFSTGADWLDVDDKIPPNTTSYTVRYLAPAMTYGFQMSAVNEAGYGIWGGLNITMPADVPPKVSWVQMLASTNETLLFGWRRPSHDNGSNITFYVVNLNQDEKLVSNETLHVLPAMRNNHMFIFVGLEPGECYSFQVQACSILGCGTWSDQLEAVTSDGVADPPENVEIKCFHDIQQNINYLVVTWEFPKNVRGSIQGFNVTLEGNARYRNMDGAITNDQFKESSEIKSDSLEFKSTIKPNTNYTVRVCTMNRAGCGPQSRPTSKAVCASPPNVPMALPRFRLFRIDNDEKCKQLKLKLQRVSERTGFIRCYRVIIIKLAKGEPLSVLPINPQALNLSTYEDVHNDEGHGAYIAEAFNSENFVSEVIIGDNKFSICEWSDPEQQSSDQIEAQMWDKEMEYVYDGSLSPSTNYTGFVEVHVLGPNGTILSKQSPYFPPTQTGSLTPPRPTPSSGGGSGPPVRAESPVAFIFGVICGTILVVLVLVLVICLIRRRHGHPYDEEGEHLGLTALIRRTVHRNGHLPRGSHLSKLPHLGPIAAEDLPVAFVERHLDTDFLFNSEFEALPDAFQERTTHASDSPENLTKNRYQDIKAYDQTRVRLSLVHDEPGSDYINANFVAGYKGRKVYICAQGPVDCTVVDFWRMILEHRISVVVMLTGIEEQGKIKCTQYWSDEGLKQVTKFIYVTLISLKKYSNYIVRRLLVNYENQDDVKEEKEILHFQFMLWKDFLTPEQPSWLLRFIKRVNEHYSNDRGPLLVHCSVGIGRTGTFVAIDHLLQQLEEESQVDIFTCVTNLRYQRNYLVQTMKQYIFIYRALMEHAQFGDTEIEIHHLRDHYVLLKMKIGETERTGIEIEFQKLGEVIEDAKTCCVGTMEMNKSRNRYECIIPYDVNRVILPPSISQDHSSYINASFIQGYDRSLSFIITQDPLLCTFTEFWRMLKEHNVTTVVMLSEIGDSLVTCPQYWPEEDEEKEYDTIKVKLKYVEKGVHYFKRIFAISNTKSGDDHIVTHFQMIDWSSSSGTVPENIGSIIALIEDSQTNQEQASSCGPITIHCSGGGNRCSVFATLAVLIHQLKTDERVDVFQAARYCRSQRPGMLQTLEQYEFLYKGLLEYLEIRSLYDMGDTQL